MPTMLLVAQLALPLAALAGAAPITAHVTASAATASPDAIFLLSADMNITLS
jgi:hypothetical protein